MNPVANMLDTSNLFIGSMLSQHVIIFESICATSLIIITPSRFTDGTPLSPSDLLSPSLVFSLLPSWTTSSKSNAISFFLSSWTKLFEVQLSIPLKCSHQTPLKNCLSRNSFSFLNLMESFGQRNFVFGAPLINVTRKKGGLIFSKYFSERSLS